MSFQGPLKYQETGNAQQHIPKASPPALHMRQASRLQAWGWTVTLTSGQAADGLSRKVRPAPKEMEAMMGRGPSSVILSEGEARGCISIV